MRQFIQDGTVYAKPSCKSLWTSQRLCQDLLGQNQRSCQKVRHNRHPYVGKLSAAKASEAWKTSTSAVFAGRALPK